jgi:hypothetical protein
MASFVPSLAFAADAKEQLDQENRYEDKKQPGQ